MHIVTGLRCWWVLLGTEFWGSELAGREEGLAVASMGCVRVTVCGWLGGGFEASALPGASDLGCRQRCVYRMDLSVSGEASGLFCSRVHVSVFDRSQPFDVIARTDWLRVHCASCRASIPSLPVSVRLYEYRSLTTADLDVLARMDIATLNLPIVQLRA